MLPKLDRLVDEIAALHACWSCLSVRLGAVRPLLGWHKAATVMNVGRLGARPRVTAAAGAQANVAVIWPTSTRVETCSTLSFVRPVTELDPGLLNATPMRDASWRHGPASSAKAG